MRYLSSYIVGLLFIWLTSCGTSKPEHIRHPLSSQKSTFKTAFISTNFGLERGGLSKPAQIQYQVRAHCPGQHCIPEKGELSFYLETGANTVYVSDYSLTIRAGDSTYYWKGRHWNNIYNSPPVLGLIKKVSLKWDELIHIAKTQKVGGVLAGQSFEWSYKNREAIRTLLTNISSIHQQADQNN